MNAPLKAVPSTGSLQAAMGAIGREARAAARILALAGAAQKNRALAAMAKSVRASRAAILTANAEDVAEAKSAGAAAAFLDRLTLKPASIEAMAAGIETIRRLKDPIGGILATWRRPNGMRIERVRVPLGVVGVIYESRPNVTADAGALCLKAGNAVILRGGSESFRSSRAIHAAMVAGLVEAGLPAAAISLVPTRDREAVGMMLAGLDGSIDVVVPRGGKSSGRSRSERGTRSGLCPPGRRLPRLRRSQSQAANGQGHRAQRKDAADRRMRCGRDFVGRPCRDREIAQATDRHADRCRLRDSRRCRRAGGRRSCEARERIRLEHRISGCDHHRRCGRRSR